jgi:pilus assembly protein FimV
MVAMMPRILILACLFGPSFADALGLGEIHLNSALNEPLRAQIDLVAATPDEVAALRASLAPREAFTRYGIDRPQFLNSIAFKVGKGKDNRDVLLVTSTEAIPEPFITFLVEVNWARGRLMREYTLLLDPPVYSPGETPNTVAPVAPATTPSAASAGDSVATSQPVQTQPAPPAAPTAAAPLAAAAAAGTYRVNAGDTLGRIARRLRAGGPGEFDQTMIALFRANPQAFEGNINLLRRGAILRVPGGDQIAAVNQREAISEVGRQMNAWRKGADASASAGHLRLVTPKSGGGATGAGDASAANSESLALKGRIKDLESQLTESRRLLDVRNSELSDLQRRLAAAQQAKVLPSAVPTAPAALPTQSKPTEAQGVAPPAMPAPATKPAVASSPAVITPPPAVPAGATNPSIAAAPTSTTAPIKAATKPPGGAGSWLDWVTDNWQVPAAAIALLLAGLVFAAFRRRQKSQIGDFAAMTAASSGAAETTAKMFGVRKDDDSFLVEESGTHRIVEVPAAPIVAPPAKLADDTLSSENAVNLDQGDPLAEADFHMAYGLYDQAADLVRIALEREPDRRDLRLKLLEIYFVWGNKDLFLQSAKALEATRDRAPPGEWDKIVIMGKQICPDDPLFSQAGGGRGASTPVDLNLEGGENRVDIDLFGDPEGERSSLDHPVAAERESDDTADTGESPHLKNVAGLDFMLDAPERGADDSPTREMPPRAAMPPRDEPTVESERMQSADAPTQVSPLGAAAYAREQPGAKSAGSDPTAEVSIDDLGLDLGAFDDLNSQSSRFQHVPEAGGADDAPTMVAGMDERSRRLIADAESRSRDADMTDLERELETSFIADADGSDDELGTSQDNLAVSRDNPGESHDEPDELGLSGDDLGAPNDTKTAILHAEAAPTVQMPRDIDAAATSPFKSVEFSDTLAVDVKDLDSTSRLRGISPETSIDLDLDRLSNALGTGGDTIDQPRAEEDLFSSEVFETSQSQRNRRLDVDLGEPAANGVDAHPSGIFAKTDTATMAAPAGAQEFEPVTMSEVGTKLDLARAYMDMGDPEGARNILDEVVQEGSASQRQEAERLIQALPG